jgi:acetoin utilization deacetylase AcuC-like enzyme
MTIQTLEMPPRKPRIMYLDLDLHFSDAVSEAFHNPSRGSSQSQVLVSLRPYSINVC